MGVFSQSAADLKAFRPTAGMTMLEMCIAMMIIAVLSIGIASMIRGGVESQLNDRTYVTMQAAMGNMTNDMRFDLANAAAVTFPNGNPGNTLQITTATGGTVTYQLTAAGDFTRTVAGGAAPTKYYNKISPTVDYQPALNGQCMDATGTAVSSCFEGCALVETPPAGSGVFAVQCGAAAIPAGQNPTKVRMPWVNMIASPTAGLNTYLDTTFGPPRFSVQMTTFSLLGNMTFK